MFEPTTLLFHETPYERQFSAWIDAVEVDERGRPFLILDRTLFYPQGGGQRGDRGRCELTDDASIAIVDTRKDGPVVYHYLDDEVDLDLVRPLVGSRKVDLEIDWAHRYEQMRVHSAAHLIHCFAEEAGGSALAPPRQSPLSDGSGENQYDYVEGWDESLLVEATTLMNEMTAAASEPVEIQTYADEDSGPGFRWWRCAEWSIPCGGTHPRFSNEIGPVSTSLRVKKGKARVQVRLES